MNAGLSYDIKKKFMLPLTIELQDHKEKVFHNAPVSHIDVHSIGLFIDTRNLWQHSCIFLLIF